MNVNLKGICGLAGRFRLIVRDGSTMEVTKDTGWFNNLILDQGLNEYASPFIHEYCRVGTSNVAPNTAQTALVAQVAATNDKQEYLSGNGGAPTYYGWTRTRFRFSIGAAAGNLSEVGIGKAATTGLFSRALIVDGGGSPVTVTVLPTEVLDVWYELRMYVDLSDRVFQLQIGPVLHDCVLRAANVNTFQTPANNSTSFAQGYTTSQRCTLYSGALGAITGQPATSIASTNISGTVQAYSNNSYRRATQFTWGINQPTSAASVRCAHLHNSPIQCQVEFTPPIAKTTTNTLTLTFRMTWARYVP
jgi:hypothetical protein